MRPEPRLLIVDVLAAAPTRQVVGPAAWCVLESLAAMGQPGSSVVELAVSTRSLAESFGMSKD
ncbi:MAG: hypothetical protein GY798_04305 [Hyphomicrobiales bacterium]|nr:hypothetical protein [Hyphomicrobiales bacterium]